MRHLSTVRHFSYFQSSLTLKMRLSPLLIACSQAAEPTFYDEFDDLSNWIIHVVPDSHNNEYQYYTDSLGFFMQIIPQLFSAQKSITFRNKENLIKRPKNVRVEDGYLKITPLREKYAHRDYTSGKVTSKFHQKFGRWEIRAKQPNGRGLWPAIWMMPQFSGAGHLDKTMFSCFFSFVWQPELSLWWLACFRRNRHLRRSWPRTDKM